MPKLEEEAQRAQVYIVMGALQVMPPTCYLSEEARSYNWYEFLEREKF